MKKKGSSNIILQYTSQNKQSIYGFLYQVHTSTPKSTGNATLCFIIMYLEQMCNVQDAWWGTWPPSSHSDSFFFTSPFTRLILSLCVCVCLFHCLSMHVAVRDNSLEQVYSVHLVKPRDPALIVKPMWSTSTHWTISSPPSLLFKKSRVWLLFQNTSLFKEYELAVLSDGQVQLRFAFEPSLTLYSPKRTVTF